MVQTWVGVEENLRKRKITCVSWCFMCKESGEDVNLVLHCWINSCLWWKILRWFRLEWVMLSTMKETMLSWAFRSRKKRCMEWDVVPLALMWIIWLERNRRAFDRSEKDFVHLSCTHRFTTCIDEWVLFVENMSSSKVVYFWCTFCIHASICPLFNESVVISFIVLTDLRIFHSF